MGFTPSSRLFLIAGVGVLLLAQACALADGADGDGDEGGDDGGRGGGSDGARDEVFPAFTPAMPQIGSVGGPVLARPAVVVITFAGDDLADDLERFAQRFGSSEWWRTVTAEYGIGPATALAPVRLEDAFPTSITTDEISAFLAQKIEDGTLPPGDDGNTLYTLFVPPTTDVESDGFRLCRDFLGGHNEGALLSNGAAFPWIIAGRCAGASDLATMTLIASHELVEAATDPFPGTNPGVVGIDAEHWAFNQAFLSEAADLCTDFPALVPDDIGYAVQRAWSNAAAAAYRNPCAPDDGPAFFSVPVLDETVALFNGLFTTPSVNVPVGEERSIELDLLSDADTGGPWHIDVVDELVRRGAPAELAFTLDRDAGENGDRLTLTIHRLAAAASAGSTAFVIVNTLPDGRKTEWAAFAGM